MKRFNCPRCDKSLSFRLLPTVPLSALPEDFSFEGGLLFYCVYCGAVLTYNEPLPTLRTRAFWAIVSLSGLVLFSFIHAIFGRAIVFLALGVTALIIGGTLVFNPKPAYKIVNFNHFTDKA